MKIICPTEANIFQFPTASFFHFRSFIPMNPILYPRRRKLDHSTPRGIEYPEYFLTICCRKGGLNQLCRTGAGERVLEAARHYHKIRRWHCELMVLMPDHLHALVSPFGRASIDQIVRSFKSWTAKECQVKWQNGFFEHRLRDGASAEQKWMYVNENPVRRCFIHNPLEWPWRFTGRANHPDSPIGGSTIEE